MYLWDSGKGPVVPIQRFQIRPESGKKTFLLRWESNHKIYPVSSEVREGGLISLYKENNKLRD
jgi:hypothetical protein